MEKKRTLLNAEFFFMLLQVQIRLHNYTYVT